MWWQLSEAYGLKNVILHNTDFPIYFIIIIIAIIYGFVLEISNKDNQSALMEESNNATVITDFDFRMQRINGLIKYDIYCNKQILAKAEFERNGNEKFLVVLEEDKTEWEAARESKHSYSIKGNGFFGSLEINHFNLNLYDLEGVRKYSFLQENQETEFPLIVGKILTFDFTTEESAIFTIRDQKNDRVGRFFPRINNLELYLEKETKNDIGTLLLLAVIIFFLKSDANRQG